MKDFDFVNDEFDKMLIYSREDYIKAVAKEDGILEGQKKGLVEGQKKGLVEGQRIAIKNMLNDNISLENIKKYLNLNDKELKELLKNI